MGKEPYQPAPPFKGAGWIAETTRQRRDPAFVRGGKEIVLQATSWRAAQRALDLIAGCHQLIMAGPPVFASQPIANNDDEPEWMDPESKEVHANELWCTSNFPLACCIAGKASRRRRWTYAVAKYKFSLSTFSVHGVDQEPRAVHLPISAFPDDHVKFAHAIISAYSVLEDLRVTVQASQAKPSRIRGKWNPEVKDDLERRLARTRINLGETILWAVRGPKRRIERRRSAPEGKLAPWSAWMVRDTEIPVVDAIAYAGWLRSKVAAHAVNDLTGALSPYDVINVQHVARRLLLETLGFWRWHEKMVRTKRVMQSILGNP